MSSYINIHTHRARNDAGHEIVSFYQDFDRVGDTLCSAGLHPWYIRPGLWEKDMEQLRLVVRKQNVLAIGECGLDKLTQTPWELQLEAFRAQIDLAHEVRKLLIIHCVRAFEELLHVFREKAPQVPVIIHGFHKKTALAEKLLAAGFYLSFGKALLTSDTARAAFLHTPEDRFFLETDDGDISIAGIYKAAATVRKTSEETIILHAQNNFQKVFRS